MILIHVWCVDSFWRNHKLTHEFPMDHKICLRAPPNQLCFPFVIRGLSAMWDPWAKSCPGLVSPPSKSAEQRSRMWLLGVKMMTYSFLPGETLRLAGSTLIALPAAAHYHQSDPILPTTPMVGYQPGYSVIALVRAITSSHFRHHAGRNCERMLEDELFEVGRDWKMGYSCNIAVFL